MRIYNIKQQEHLTTDKFDGIDDVGAGYTRLTHVHQRIQVTESKLVL